MTHIIQEPGGENIQVSGDDAHIYPNNNTKELLLGMPFLRQNRMHMRSDDKGDTIEI